MKRVAIGLLLALAATGVWFATRAPVRVPQENAQGSGSASDFEPLDQHAFKGERQRELQLVAQSPEEAYWLESHGYPRPSVWAAREQSSQAELEARVANGDTLAMVMLAERLFAPAQPGDVMQSPGRQRSLDLLQRAFEGGNFFAQVVMAQTTTAYLKQTSRASATGGIENRSYAAAVLNVEMLSLLGDYRAADLLLSLEIPRGRTLDASGVASAMMTAHRVLADVNARRGARGLPPISPVPRPGAMTAQEARLARQPIRQWRGWH